MKSMLYIGAMLCASQLFLSASVQAAVARCGNAPLLGFVPADDEVKAHRRFDVPTLSYPHGTSPGRMWGLGLTLRVDSQGRVICFDPHTEFDENPSMGGLRQSLPAAMAEWRYAPFAHDGKAVPAIVNEQVKEQELPERHVSLPEVPLARVSISLHRTGCFGICPSYSLVLHGDGRASYRGEAFVDVHGDHAFHVAPGDVARLVEKARSADLWSLRPEYRTAVTDNPTYEVELDFGDQKHRILDYIGQSAGMPAAVSDFEQAIDVTGHSEGWLHLSQEVVDALVRERFTFRSKEGANLLARAVADDRSTADAAMRRLIDLGAPITGGDLVRSRSTRPVIEEALLHQRGEVFDALLSAGALDTEGKPDQQKIDAAFRAAIAGGSLELVERVWTIRGSRAHPALTFDSTSDDGGVSIHRLVPVSLLIAGDLYGTRRSPDRVGVARWLAAKGCNLRAASANGETLLHIAAGAGDIEFVRFLLSQGFDPSTKGHFGLVALDGTHSEGVAMILLDAGTRFDDKDRQFRKFAEYNHWQRVVGWLDAHGK